MSLRFKCPVCGWNGLEHLPSFPYSSHEICACCGTQFGLDVVDDKDIVSVRKAWLDEGALWFDHEVDVNPRKPENWNVIMAKSQIKNSLGINV